MAEAPSRKISTRAIAPVGIKARSVATEPGKPSSLTMAVVCRRLPLTSTRVCEGSRLRSWPARTMLPRSGCTLAGKVSEGKAESSASSKLSLPVATSCCALITSIGAALLSTVRPEPRAPVTITASSGLATTSAETCARAIPGCTSNNTATDTACASRRKRGAEERTESDNTCIQTSFFNSQQDNSCRLKDGQTNKNECFRIRLFRFGNAQQLVRIERRTQKGYSLAYNRVFYLCLLVYGQNGR